MFAGFIKIGIIDLFLNIKRLEYRRKHDTNQAHLVQKWVVLYSLNQDGQTHRFHRHNIISESILYFKDSPSLAIN